MNPPSPTTRRLIDALRAVGGVLGEDVAYVYEGRFHFRLDSRWSVALSPESAGRFRLDACYGGRILATMWCLADDEDRLAALALSARREVEALV